VTEGAALGIVGLQSGAPTSQRGQTILSSLLGDMAQAAEDEAITLGVKKRPGFEVRCRTDISYEELTAWNTAAADDSMPLGVNEITLGRTLLAVYTVEILKDGETVVGSDGRPITFNSPEFQAFYGVDRPVDAVRAFYRSDGQVIGSSRVLLNEAGYGAGGVPTRR
jgi:hypothetical protein